MAIVRHKHKTAHVDSIILMIEYNSDFVWKPCTSPFIELLGKGFMSLNIDIRRKESYSISIGTAVIEEGISPNVMG